MTLLEESAASRIAGHSVLQPGVEATFILADPVRESWFALWNPEAQGGLFGAASGDLEHVDVHLQRPKSRGTTSLPFTCQRLPLATAIDEFAGLQNNADVTESVRVWAHVLRFGLDLVVRAKVLPWVSPQGWDTWRVDPLDSEEVALVEAYAQAMPAEAHCVPSAEGTGRIADSKHLIRGLFDAVADHTIRSAAAEAGLDVPIFAEPDRLRVRHLRPWVTDLAAMHCAASSVLFRIHPPPEPPTRDAPPGADQPETANDDAEVVDRRWTVAVEIRSQEDPSLVVPARDLPTLAPEVLSRLGQRVGIDVLLGLRVGSEVCGVLAPLLEQDQPSELKLDESELDELLCAADALSAAGIELHWPTTLSTPALTRRLVVHADMGPQSAMKSTLGIDALLDVDWEFLLNGVALDADELQLLSDAKRSVVSLRGRWVRVDSSTSTWLRAKPPKMTVAQGLAAALGSPLNVADHGDGGPGEQTVDVVLDGPLAEMVDRITTYDRATELAEPERLQATLRPYQRQGLAWLTDLVRLGLGACLADDMGLGKTIQILALHETLHQAAVNEDGSGEDSKIGRSPAHGRPTLVVCPTSLLNNWEREAATFLPHLNVHRFHGPKRSLEAIGDADLVVTTYGVVRSDHETLATVEWGIVAADEAQAAKNPQSRTARSLRKIPAASRIAMTGTPVENHLTELWSIVDWMLPGLLGNVDRFRRMLAVPIERDGNKRATEQLHQVVSPFLLRRRKTDPGVAPDLPPKTERDVVVPLTEEQISLYRAAVEEALVVLAKEKGPKRRGRILSLLTSLKQITNHPAHYLAQAGPMLNRSGKLRAVDEILDMAIDNDESTLMFTQYVAMGELLVAHLTARGVRVELLHGGLSVQQRQTLVDDFQAGKLDVLVLSLKAGGTGLNLTKATQVIHYDRWWNPAVEDQATDRAYRIGQGKPVTVHRIITEGTVEDRVAELLKNKRELSDRVLNAGTGWIGNLDNDELAALVSLDSSVGTASAESFESASRQALEGVR